MGLNKAAVIDTTEAVGTLVPGTDYRFLFSPSWSPIVYLVEFGSASERKQMHRAGDPKSRKKARRKVEPRAFLHFVPKAEFEKKLEAGVIRIKIQSEFVPPWLEGKSQEQLDALSDRRRVPKEFHDDRIDRRLIVIQGAASRIKEPLLADEPIKAINALASKACRLVGSARFRFWLLSYLLYGRIGLHYSVAKIGKWDRKLKAETCPDSTHKVTDAIAKRIVDAYTKERKQGGTREDIYVEAMTKSFGCRSLRDKDRNRVLYHPAGDWFPSIRVFFYHVDRALGKEEVVKDRVGQKRHHGELAPDRGSYTEFVGNAYEWVEYDPFYNSWNPRSNNGKPLPKLSVGRLKDGASGSILGLGFDLGGETKEQIAAALFCTAIDKVKFASLFGIKIEKEDWPSEGLPSRIILDRGAGFTAFERPQDRQGYWPEVQAAPRGVGQAKAMVETSHPKKLQDKEGPHYNLSNKSVWHLIKDEILRVKKDNECMDVSSRIPGEWLGSMRRATPNTLFQEFDRRGRNDAVRISFESAVRTFLPLIDVTANKDGVYLGKRRYQCKELLERGFFNQFTHVGSVSLKAHHLRACVNHIWLFTSGKLYELSLTFKVNNGNQDGYLSLDELMAEEQMRQNLKKGLRDHRIGMRAETNEESEFITGAPIDTGLRKEGRPKRNRESIEEARQAVDVVRGKL